MSICHKLVCKKAGKERKECFHHKKCKLFYGECKLCDLRLYYSFSTYLDQIKQRNIFFKVDYEREILKALQLKGGFVR